MQIKHVYQPIRNLVTGKIIGHEALLRGSAGEEAMEVFAVAESQGRLFEIDQMSFAAAIAGAPPELVFANIFPATLIKMAADRRSMIGYSGARRPQEVVIELVEVFEIKDISCLRDSVEAVRAAGLMVAVDDVSDGWGRLHLIAELVPEWIKIDRKLVMECDRYPNRLAVIRCLVELARDLGARVVAEGIERPEELTALDAQGVNYGQGFLWGRPEEYRKEMARRMAMEGGMAIG
jgi:EAL domain-containing protein (putative c-di-GMP-specific phosphodiesterase class I)